MDHVAWRGARLLALVAALALMAAACGEGDEGGDATGGETEATATEATATEATATEATETDTGATPTGTATEGTEGGGTAGAPPEGEEEVTFDVYMGFAEEDVIATAEEFFANVEERSEGLMSFETSAGTESISPFESFDPLARGVVDFAVTSTVYFTDQVPEPMIDMVVTAPEDEIRQTELLEIFNEVLDPHNVHMLGWTGSGNQFLLIGNSRMETADFSGLNIRTFPAINGFILALGGSPVTVPAPERYSALERGVVDLTVAPIPSIAQERLYEVSDYSIFPPFLAVREALMFNKDVWDGLSDWKRQVLEDVVLEHEAFARAERERASGEALDLIRANTEVVELPPEEAEKLQQTAFESTFDFMAEQSSNPEAVERLRAEIDQLAE